MSIFIMMKDSDENVLKGINLLVDPGTSVALVGHTGAGKEYDHSPDDTIL